VSGGSATDDAKEKWEDMMCDLHFALQYTRNWLWLDFLKLVSVLLVHMKTWANFHCGVYCGPPCVEESHKRGTVSPGTPGHKRGTVARLP